MARVAAVVALANPAPVVSSPWEHATHVTAGKPCPGGRVVRIDLEGALVEHHGLIECRLGIPVGEVTCLQVEVVGFRARGLLRCSTHGTE